MDSVNEYLIQAAMNGNEATIQSLLRHADCEAKFNDSAGRTALMWAAYRGHTSFLQILLPLSNALAQDNDGYTALIWAAGAGHTSCLQLLLPVSDPKATNKNGDTALIYSATNGHNSCVQMLLPVSECSAENKRNKNASSLAAYNGYPEISCLINAYALSVTEQALLESSISLARDRRSRSLRV